MRDAESDLGSRDPYELSGTGAGYALCWRGNPSILIGQPNEQGELIQVKSDSMLIVIPKYVLGYRSRMILILFL